MKDKEINLRLKACKTVEELKALAKEIGYELTDEEANAYFEKITKAGELNDDELANVSGGGCSKWRNGRCYSGNPPHRLIVTRYNKCPDYRFFSGSESKDIKRYKGCCPTCASCDDGSGSTLYCIHRTYNDDKYNPN